MSVVGACNGPDVRSRHSTSALFLRAQADGGGGQVGGDGGSGHVRWGAVPKFGGSGRGERHPCRGVLRRLS